MNAYSIRDLKGLRKRSNVTTAQASRDLGISQRRLLAYEAGQSQASEELRLRWSKLVSEPIRRRYRRRYGDQAYGKLINQASILMGIDRAELAFRAGVSLITVSNWFRSEDVPTQRHQKVVTSILGPLAIYDGALILFNGPEMKRLRMGKGLTQVDLAKKIGKSKETISAWELAACAPRKRNIGILAEVLCVSIEKLYSPGKPSEVFRAALDASGFSHLCAARFLGVSLGRCLNLWVSGDVWPPTWAIRRLKEVAIRPKPLGYSLKLRPVPGLIELYSVSEKHITTLDGIRLADVDEYGQRRAVLQLIKTGVLAKWSQRVDVGGDVNASSEDALREFKARRARLRLQRSVELDRWRFHMDSKTSEIVCEPDQAAVYVLEALQWGRLPITLPPSGASDWQHVSFGWA